MEKVPTWSVTGSVTRLRPGAAAQGEAGMKVKVTVGRGTIRVDLELGVEGEEWHPRWRHDAHAFERGPHRPSWVMATPMGLFPTMMD
jgi:hypothetical protein